MFCEEGRDINVSLVRELQWVQLVLYKGAEVIQNQPLKGTLSVFV